MLVTAVLGEERIKPFIKSLPGTLTFGATHDFGDLVIFGGRRNGSG
jgi:hypothetical protein